jgi:hypothetical protein
MADVLCQGTYILSVKIKIVIIINTFGKPLSEKCIALLFLTQKKSIILIAGSKQKKKFLHSSTIFNIIFHGKWFIKRVGAYLETYILSVKIKIVII